MGAGWICCPRPDVNNISTGGDFDRLYGSTDERKIWIYQCISSLLQHTNVKHVYKFQVLVGSAALKSSIYVASSKSSQTYLRSLPDLLIELEITITRRASTR